MEHFRKLERMYAAAPINQRDSPELTVEDGRAQLSMQVKPHHHHAAGAMHGSIYFKMLDDACFFAANSRVTETFVLTAHFEVNLLRPVSCGEIRACAWVTKEGGRTVRAQGEVRDDSGEVIAKGGGVFVVSEIGLGPACHYI